MAVLDESCAVGRSDECYLKDEELIAILAPSGECRRLEAGASLFSVGEPASGMYLILKGSVQARLAVNGQEIMCRTAGRGAVLGLSAAMCSGHYKFNAHALEAAEAAFLETARVNEILRGRPELGLRVMNLMCDEMEALRQTRDRMRSCTRQACGLYEACRQESAANPVNPIT